MANVKRRGSAIKWETTSRGCRRPGWALPEQATPADFSGGTPGVASSSAPSGLLWRSDASCHACGEPPGFQSLGPGPSHGDVSRAPPSLTQLPTLEGHGEAAVPRQARSGQHAGRGCFGRRQMGCQGGVDSRPQGRASAGWARLVCSGGKEKRAGQWRRPAHPRQPASQQLRASSRDFRGEQGGGRGEVPCRLQDRELRGAFSARCGAPQPRRRLDLKAAQLGFKGRL